MAAHEAVALAAAYRSSISWDSHHMTPYFRYSSEGQQHEVHFENERSLREKIALVEEYGLRGMALWRLGYEVPEVWEEIQRWQLGR
jgi:spore germination protein